MSRELSEHEHWLLSYYRTSEISGAQFFGKLAQSMRPSPLQMNLTRHFADESVHAWEWTQCIARFGRMPLRLGCAYQDRYAAVAGLPINLMEVLCLTLVFEKRVIKQYALHRRAAALQEPVRRTLARIIRDERWHISWVRKALGEMEHRFGRERIEETIALYRRADREVYRSTLHEHRDRVEGLRDLMENGGRI